MANLDAIMDEVAEMAAKVDALGKRADALGKRADAVSDETQVKNAEQSLERLKDMLFDGGEWDIAGIKKYASSANRYLKTLTDNGKPLPKWLTRTSPTFFRNGWDWKGI